MRQALQRPLFILLGWLFVLLAIVGVVLPVLPTTPFLIAALALFANSSPRFHGMLLNNRWVGEILIQWEENNSVSRKTKIRATLLLIVSFSLSIVLVSPRVGLQLMLVVIAVTLLVFIWRLKES
jgi:uncharacterized membrane protein YbaN (DUF454 family)